MNTIAAAAPVLAHGSGVDDFVFVCLVVAFFAAVVLVAKRRADRLQGQLSPGDEEPGAPRPPKEWRS